MPAPCLTCLGGGVTSTGQLCGECKQKAEDRIPLGPEEEIHPLARGPDPDTVSLIADQRRIIKELQTRWRFEHHRLERMADGKTTGRLVDRGLTKDMIQEAKTISDMLADITDVYRKWIAAEKEAAGEMTPAEMTVSAGDWLSSTNVPADEKRKQLARILASLGEIYAPAPLH